MNITPRTVLLPTACVIILLWLTSLQQVTLAIMGLFILSVTIWVVIIWAFLAIIFNKWVFWGTDK